MEMVDLQKGEWEPVRMKLSWLRPGPPESHRHSMTNVAGPPAIHIVFAYFMRHHMRRCLCSILGLSLFPAVVLAATQEPAIRHTVVFQEEGRFAGWPANHGIWSWDDEIVVGFVLSIRSDGSTWDIGYPRTVQRSDGKCVTIYYYHNSESPERYIACTIWDPNPSR